MPNPIRPIALAVAGVLSLLCMTAEAATPAVECVVNGVNVRASAVSDTVFRLSFNARGPAKPLASVYLDPSPALDAAAEVGGEGTNRSIKTAAGELRIDTATGRYSLLSARGETLVPFSTPVVGPVAADGPLAVHVGWPKGRPFAVYGSGNPTGSLTQKDVKASVGNGLAVQPFFWSPTGFATFVVGDTADKPASCDGTIRDDSVTWQSPGTAADVYLIVAPTLGDASRTLLSLTGRPPVPPRWTFGYLQSRWGWQDAAYIDDAVAQFDRRKLPVDAFIFDFEWYTTKPDYEVPPPGEANFSDFNFNPKLFPDKNAPIKRLTDAGLKFVGIRKPRLGNKDTLVFVRQQGWGLPPLPGQGYDRRALNYADPAVRTWYAEQTKPLDATGVAGWWNDEGEFTYTNYQHWNAAEQQSLSAVRPQSRFWSLNRAFSPGLSRTGAAAWTGDVRADWAALKRCPTDILNWSMAGMPYGACDVGGFGGETSPELLTRWMQAATFFPVQRTHSEVLVKPHFPWLFGEEAEAAMKRAIELRYRLVPTLYSLAHACHDTGEPLVRPLVAAYPDDPKVANLSSQWLLGDGLMAAPVLEPGGRRSVYLPKGTWYDFATNAKLDGDRSIDVTATLADSPAYARAGTILALATVATRTADLANGPLEVRVFAGRDADFTLVEDDGATTAYLNGATRKTTFHWNDATGELSWKRTGTFAADCYQTVRVTVVGDTVKEASEQPLTEAGRVTVR